jgi:hypothetical protein
VYELPPKKKLVRLADLKPENVDRPGRLGGMMIHTVCVFTDPEACEWIMDLTAAQLRDHSTHGGFPLKMCKREEYEEAFGAELKFRSTTQEYHAQRLFETKSKDKVERQFATRFLMLLKKVKSGFQINAN